MTVTTRKTPIRYRRGKPIPELRYGDVIDWTTFPLGSKPNGRRIGVCPSCGRKGQVTHYKNAEAHVIHGSRFEKVFMMVTDSCHIPASKGDA